MKLVLVEEDDRVDGETYLTQMKHGWISGVWTESYTACFGYYWEDLEWTPYVTYRMEKDE